MGRRLQRRGPGKRNQKHENVVVVIIIVVSAKTERNIGRDFVSDGRDNVNVDDDFNDNVDNDDDDVNNGDGLQRRRGSTHFRHS